MTQSLPILAVALVFGAAVQIAPAQAQTAQTEATPEAPTKVHYRHGGEGRRDGMKRGGHRKQARGARALEEMLERYDTDADGGLTEEELVTARGAQLGEFDTNGDGSLSLEEYEQLWLQAMRERMVDRFQSHDDDGDGLVTVEEFTEEVSRMIARADRNGDGTWNAEDMQRRKGRRPADRGADSSDQ